jgi:hypothetical protein
MGEQTTATVAGQKQEKRGVFEIKFYEPPGMPVKEFAKERFAPPTRSVGVSLPGYPLPSSSEPGKKDNRKKKEKSEG